MQGMTVFSSLDQTMFSFFYATNLWPLWNSACIYCKVKHRSSLFSSDFTDIFKMFFCTNDPEYLDMSTISVTWSNAPLSAFSYKTK